MAKIVDALRSPQSAHHRRRNASITPAPCNVTPSQAQGLFPLSAADDGHERVRVLFLTREPLLHQAIGSTTYALNFIEWLTSNGCDVTVVATLARSRSPRLWVRMRTAVPEGVRFILPDMLRFGNLYLLLFSPIAWARFFVRVAERLPLLRPLSAWLLRRCGDRLTDLAWDLTTLTAGERALALRYVADSNASTLIANYAFWGPLFDAPSLRTLRRVVLMHDLLSERVVRFRATGLQLDCPPLDAATEFAWLNKADCVLAAQQREAAMVRANIGAQVLVQPTIFNVEQHPSHIDPNRVLLVGANIPPNRNGLDWFLQQVWPLVLAQNPVATLAIAGTLGAAVKGDVQGVEALGIVDSIAGQYARAAVCIIPLLVGSGVKIKLVEALAYGKAAVSTSVGVEGLENILNGVVEVADDAPKFAAAVLQLLGDEQERDRRATAGFAVAQRHFSAQQPLPVEFARFVLGREQ